MPLRELVGVFLCGLLLIPVAAAQPAPEIPDITKVPAAAQPSDHFDVDAATNAYLALMPASARARSDAYFEGGYWLILWDFLMGAAISLLLLNLGWSAGMRNLAELITKFKNPQTFLYWVQYLVLTSILGFPLAVYEGFFRKWKYGLATQTFGAWMGDQLKGLGIDIVLGGIGITLLFVALRRLPRTWWIWGSIGTLVFMIFVVMIGPVFLQPIFNKVTRLDDPRMTVPILKMAQANSIPVHDVWEIDASRQTTRMSANVSGFGRTMRITLNDNLLRRGSLEEIEAVMGHEMGHYVLNHIPKSMIFFLVVIVAAFAYLKWSVEWCLERWGAKWRIRSISDPAVLPLLALLVSIFLFVLTPVMNTETRSQEAEADIFGVNASRQPDGMAQAALHLGEYRKMKPGPIEEFIFFDHPSGYNRIHKAMQWKADNLQLFTSEKALETAQ